mgnify:CR=1 FL=1
MLALDALTGKRLWHFPFKFNLAVPPAPLVVDSERVYVTGPYDVVVKAEAQNVDELGKLVVARIQAVEGITRTLTCPVVHL